MPGGYALGFVDLAAPKRRRRKAGPQSLSTVRRWADADAKLAVPKVKINRFGTVTIPETMRWGLKGAAKRGLNPRDSLEGTRYMQLFAQSVHDRLGFSKRRGFDRERWARMNREHDAEYWARKARAHLFKSRKR